MEYGKAGLITHKGSVLTLVLWLYDALVLGRLSPNRLRCAVEIKFQRTHIYNEFIIGEIFAV